ncbi:hypothetical protein CXB49_09895 [Chromobacterium sp. ATCC 53434]|uniref:aerolysin family beta-barrel pore-forming toxin n=1 Tax=Chromobacterium sp. (strain ATCC 53434 / SC 14030) TaxID=2059672 RepID=UPI000C75D3C5|nr:aerolysin family beta-barrel pore-forming toxin [Chromobacterium sp. ATCC 53434]AUH51101.1 hypothetical protein CXB49_09895 [Chromobacterium sp. ATCC 53434]
MNRVKFIASAIVLFSTIQTHAWGDDTVPAYPDLIFDEPSLDNESTIRKIITNEKFFKHWTELADMLGYGWVGGNTNQNEEVGSEMEYRRIDTRLDDLSISDSRRRYMFNSKYDPNGPGGYWADKRFRMAFLNIQWETTPDDLVLMASRRHDKQPIKTIKVLLENHGDIDDSTVANLNYESAVAWSKVDNITVNGPVTVARPWNASLPLGDSEGSSVAVKINADADWITASDHKETVSQSAEYQVQLPARSKREITLTLYEQRADTPYTSMIYITYDAELYNFLRYGGNALNGHPTDRPFYLGKFGGYDGLNATRDLLSQYLRPANSKWDWPWLISQHNRNMVENQIGMITKRKFKQRFDGVFTVAASTGYVVTAGPAESLPNNGLSASRGIHYRLLSDMSDVAAKVQKLRFTLSKPEAQPSSASPFK